MKGLNPLVSLITPCNSRGEQADHDIIDAWTYVCLFRWAESELLDTLMRLEIGVAGRVEAWKATRWAAKLEQLKAKNDRLVGAPHPHTCAHVGGPRVN